MTEHKKPTQEEQIIRELPFGYSAVALTKSAKITESGFIVGNHTEEELVENVNKLLREFKNHGVKIVTVFEAQTDVRNKEGGIIGQTESQIAIVKKKGLKVKKPTPPHIGWVVL